MRKPVQSSPNDVEIGRLQGEVREREENYRDLIEGSVQGVVIRNLERCLFANETCLKMFGYDSMEEFLNTEDSYSFFAPHEREGMQARHRAIWRGESVPYSYETECRRKDGSTLWVWASSRVVTLKGQRALQATFTDISELKKAENELRRGEGRYRDLLLGLPVGLAIHREFKPLFANNAFATIFGYASGEEVCRLRSHILLVAKKDRARMHAYRRARLAGREAPSDYTFAGVRADGSMITCSAMVKVVDWEGQPAIQLCVVDITDRERAARRLQESEERYRGLIEGSVQGISIRATQRRLLVNETFAKMFGYGSAAEVIAEQAPRPVAAPHDRKRILAIHHAVLEGRQAPTQFEFEAIRNDSSRIYVYASARRIEWNGEPAVQTTCTDITERKLAEESLRASERRYRDLIEGSVQGINIRSRGERLLVNDSLARMFGFATAEEMRTSAKAFSRVAPHDRERVERIFHSLLRRRQAPKQYTFEAIRKDGSTLWLSAVSRRIEWDGRPAVQTTYTDISENRLAEEELRSSEERYRDLIEGSVQGILIRTDKPVLANEAIARMFGYASAKEIMKLKGFELVAPAERERNAYYRHARLRGELVPNHYEMEGVKKDGTSIWVSVVARLIRWKGELAIQTTFTDITDRKRTEAELIEAKMQSIGMMARGIAQEFNAIYNALLGTISMARMEAYALGGNRIVEILSEAERTGDSAKKAIQDLMVLNRAGVPVKERVSVEELLKEVLPLSGVSGKVVPIRPSKIRINLNLASSLWAVNADKVQVNQALGVLVSNGLHATPGGGILGISAENVEYRKPNRALNLEPGKYVRITIRDQGVRISPEHLKMIFDPYFSPTRDNGGIGLASAYSIIRQHEGTIKVVSHAATGNRFQVFLPAHMEEQPRRKGTGRRPSRRRAAGR